MSFPKRGLRFASHHAWRRKENQQTSNLHTCQSIENQRKRNEVKERDAVAIFLFPFSFSLHRFGQIIGRWREKDHAVDSSPSSEIMNEKANVTKELNARHRKVWFISSLFFSFFFSFLGLWANCFLLCHGAWFNFVIVCWVSGKSWEVKENSESLQERGLGLNMM